MRRFRLKGAACTSVLSLGAAGDTDNSVVAEFPLPQCYFRPMAGWAARHVTEIPRVADGEVDDPDWYPLQHFFGVATFGANVFVATQGTETLVAEHDEQSSGQQELYVVLEVKLTSSLRASRFT
jgi:hypothetical protein